MVVEAAAYLLFIGTSPHVALPMQNMAVCEKARAMVINATERMRSASANKGGVTITYLNGPVAGTIICIPARD